MNQPQSEASEDDRAGSGEGASGPADGTVGDAEDVEEDAEEEEGVRVEAGPTDEIDVDDALADLTLAQRQELVELAKTFQGTISEEDLPALAAKYELDPPQVAAVVASMWAKHLDRPLTARKKKRELKPNSRYDQDSIANAEAAEEEEEEERVEAGVTPMDEDQHTPRGTKHLDDDDEDVSYDEKTGISAEVRVQVTCGDMRGTAVLPAGYKKQQEYVLHSDGKKVPPSQFERDAGKGSCKNWKNSVMVVMPDGSEGRTFRVWMESNGYFPVGTKWDESVVNAARALMGRRKKVNHGDKSSHAVKTQPAAKKPKPAPAQAAKKVEKVAEKAPVEKSIFEAQLENLLDDDGGLRLVEKMPNFVWLMRNAMKNAERSLVVSVIHRTNDRKCAEAFVKSDGIKVLHEWCAQAKESNKSSLVLKMLKTFRRLPMTVTALSSTGLGNFVNKLRKYKPPGKDNDDLTKQVIEEAERVKLKWVSVVRAESEAADLRAKKESEESSKQKAAANAANAATKRPLVPQTAEEAAKRRKVEPTGPAAGASTPSQGSKETSTGGINKTPPAKVPTATKVGVPKPTTTIARTVTTIARPTTSSVTSFGGVNVRGVAAYRKDPTAGKLSSAGSGSKTSTGGVGSVLKSREPEKKKEFFTKSNYAKKKSSKLQKLQSAGKQGRVGIGWKADAELEAVKFFFKDDFIVADKSADPAEERRRAAQERRDAARQKEKEEEEDVEPEDEDERAAIAKARERQQKEKAAEQRAANLTRVRRLNEMKATGRWVQPRRIEYPPGWDIHPGRDSGERGRLQSRWKGEFEVKYRSPDQIPESPREAPFGSQGSNVDPPTMIEVSTKPPPKAPPSHAGPPMSGGGFNNVQQSSTAFNPPLPGGPPPPGTNQLQSMLQQFGSQGVNQGGNPGGNQGGQGAGGIDQSALQALLQSVQSGALKVQGGPGNGGGLNGGGMNGGGGPPPLPPGGVPPNSFGAPPPQQHAPMGPGMSSRAYNQGAMPPGLGGGGMGGGPSIGGSVNNGGMIPGQGQGHTHESWRPLADGGQKGPMPGGNGMCAFFNTPKGCYHGDNCRFRHERGAAPPPPGAYPNRRF